MFSNLIVNVEKYGYAMALISM